MFVETAGASALARVYSQLFYDIVIICIFFFFFCILYYFFLFVKTPICKSETNTQASKTVLVSGMVLGRTMQIDNSVYFNSTHTAFSPSRANVLSVLYQNADFRRTLRRFIISTQSHSATLRPH